MLALIVEKELLVSDSSQERGLLAKAVVAFVGSPVAGFLYLGRPYLAFLSLVLQILCLAGFYVLGFPSYLGQYFDDLMWLAVSIIAVLVVLPFNAASGPPRWFSKWYFAIGVSLISSSIIALSVRTFLFQPFSIPAGSMVPTLVVGDVVGVDKSAYGYSRYSFPMELVSFEGRLNSSLPTRGDVVVFLDSNGIHFVKRIVGLPGEQIKMSDGVLHINDVPTKQTVLGVVELEGESEKATLILEELPEGRRYKTIDLAAGTMLDDTKTFLVPEGHYFMMGDHRDNSADSRLNMGTISFERIIGPVDRLFYNKLGLEYSNRKFPNREPDA
jgi:signal peptidase I